MREAKEIRPRDCPQKWGLGLESLCAEGGERRRREGRGEGRGDKEKGGRPLFLACSISYISIGASFSPPPTTPAAGLWPVIRPWPGPCWFSSFSSCGSGTRSWPASQWGLAAGPPRTCGPWWGTCWRETPSPVPAFGVWYKGSASCEWSVHAAS